MTARPNLCVVAAVIESEEGLLAVRRPAGKPYAGYFEFPGGKVEPGESLETALSRELQEELDVTPVKFDFWLEKSHAYPEFYIRLHVFRVREFSGAIKPLEGQSLCWLAPEAAEPEAFLPADRELVDLLRREATSRIPNVDAGS
ncbi:MAG: (deoxy)nucleoside triphosphate pyrophosphohydrolase [Desulfovibrionaceae bacterium]